MKLRRKIFVAVTALALTSLTLAGCTGTAVPPDAAADPDATLVVTTGQGAIPQLDPGLATFQWERVLYPLLWNGLTEVTEGDEVVPGLAENWTSNDDLTSWTFTLRDDVTFTNGRAFTSEDVVWNMERVLSGSNTSVAAIYLTSVSAVHADSPNQVTFELDKPNAVLPLSLSTLRIIAPESADTINEKPIGTGPFKMDSFVPNQELKMTVNEDYWGETPELKGITIVASNDTAAAVTAIRTGDVQLLWNLPVADAAPLKSDNSVAVLESDQSTQLHYLSVDTTSPPFDDPRARKALSLALNRDEVVQTAFSGFGQPAEYNELLPQASWAFNADGMQPDTHDLDEAAALFADAGVNPGDSITWWGIAGAYPEWNLEAQILQQDLAEIGITLDIRNEEVGAWVDKFIPIPAAYPNHIVPNAGGDPNDPSFILGRLANGACECNWRDDRYDELATKALATDDRDERREYYQEMQQIVIEQTPVIVSVHAPLVTAARTNVNGAWIAPSGDLHLEDVTVGGH